MFRCIKVYKELYRILKQTNIKMGVDKVLNMAKTITTIQVQIPNSKEIISKTMIMERHKRIEKLFDDSFWVTQ
jgi:hypothetical protein